MESYYHIYGILFLFVGIFIRYQIGKRRFKRRNIAGLQIYPNYLMGLVITAIETMINLLGMFSIVFGLIAIIIEY